MAEALARTRLESWKDIAAHCKKTVRTVQRWEVGEGLPVHRLLHQSSGNVYAFKDELDAWLASRQVCPPRVETADRQPQSAAPVVGWLRRPLCFIGLVFVFLARLRYPSVVRPFRPPTPVWLLVTALDNRTGEGVLDDSVHYLIEREISNSALVYVTPRVPSKTLSGSCAKTRIRG